MNFAVRKECPMKYYAGLDVSLTETFVSIVDIDGTIIQEDIIPTEGLLIGSYLKKTGLTFDKIGIESGQLSISHSLPLFRP